MGELIAVLADNRRDVVCPDCARILGVRKRHYEDGTSRLWIDGDWQGFVTARALQSGAMPAYLRRSWSRIDAGRTPVGHPRRRSAWAAQPAPTPVLAETVLECGCTSLVRLVARPLGVTFGPMMLNGHLLDPRPAS